MAKANHLRCRIDKDLHLRLKKGARREDTTDSEFARRLLDWASEQYERVGGLAALQRTSVNGSKA
jgi:hypothetical protein